MKIDLHSHSTASDGTFSPIEVVCFAKNAGLDLFALTDHDTTKGYQLAQSLADTYDHGMRLVSGVEISTQHTLVGGGYGSNQCLTKNIHIVGLNFSDVAKMEAALEGIQQSRARRGLAMVEKMADVLMDDVEFFKKFDNDKVLLTDRLWSATLAKSDNQEQSVGRPHIAQVLQEWGVVTSVSQAFDRFLGDHRPAYVPLEGLDMRGAIDLIRACGGVSVLAHPTRYGLSATRTRRLIGEFSAFGGEACELPSLTEPDSTRSMIDREIAKYGLMVSLGSDFHGITTPWRKLGQVATPKVGQMGVWETF